MKIIIIEPRQETSQYYTAPPYSYPYSPYVGYYPQPYYYSYPQGQPVQQSKSPVEVLQNILSSIGTMYRSALIAIINAPDMSDAVQDVESFKSHAMQLIEENANYLNPLAISQLKNFVNDLANSLMSFIKSKFSVESLEKYMFNIYPQYAYFFQIMGNIPIRTIAEYLTTQSQLEQSTNTASTGQTNVTSSVETGESRTGSRSNVLFYSTMFWAKDPITGEAYPIFVNVRLIPQQGGSYEMIINVPGIGTETTSYSGPTDETSVLTYALNIVGKMVKKFLLAKHGFYGTYRYGPVTVKVNALKNSYTIIYPSGRKYNIKIHVKNWFILPVVTRQGKFYILQIYFSNGHISEISLTDLETGECWFVDEHMVRELGFPSVRDFVNWILHRYHVYNTLMTYHVTYS